MPVGPKHDWHPQPVKYPPECDWCGEPCRYGFEFSAREDNELDAADALMRGQSGHLVCGVVLKRRLRAARALGEAVHAAWTECA